MIESVIKCVVREPLTGRNVAIIETIDKTWALPIPIGENEAGAISCLLRGGKDCDIKIFNMLTTMIGELDNINPERVLIESYSSGVFSAKFYFIINNIEREIDCRPSDAFVLSLYTETPIYISKCLLDKAKGGPCIEINNSGSI